MKGERLNTRADYAMLPTPRQSHSAWKVDAYAIALTDSSDASSFDSAGW
jgi:hypothetical protein